MHGKRTRSIFRQRENVSSLTLTLTPLRQCFRYKFPLARAPISINLIVILLSSASLSATSKPMNLNKMQTELEYNLIMTVFSPRFRVEQSVGAIRETAELDSVGKVESSTQMRSARCSSAYWGSLVDTAAPRAIEKHLKAEETHVEGGECTQCCYVRIKTTQTLYGAISPIKCAGSATCISKLSDGLIRREKIDT